MFCHTAAWKDSCSKGLPCQKHQRATWLMGSCLQSKAVACCFLLSKQEKHHSSPHLVASRYASLATSAMQLQLHPVMPASPSSRNNYASRIACRSSQRLICQPLLSDSQLLTCVSLHANLGRSLPIDRPQHENECKMHSSMPHGPGFARDCSQKQSNPLQMR